MCVRDGSSVEILKTTVKTTFGSLEDKNPFSLKFHLLDQLAKDVLWFRDQPFLGAQPF